MRKRKNNGGEETKACECAQEPAEDEIESHDGLAGSLGPGRNCVKRWVEKGCAMCIERNGRAAKVKRRDTEFAERRRIGNLLKPNLLLGIASIHTAFATGRWVAAVNGGGQFFGLCANNHININELWG